MTGLLKTNARLNTRYHFNEWFLGVNDTKKKKEKKKKGLVLDSLLHKYTDSWFQTRTDTSSSSFLFTFFFTIKSKKSQMKRGHLGLLMSFGWISGIKFQVKHFHDLAVNHCFYTLCSKDIVHSFTKELQQN